MKFDAKIYVAGHLGLVGSALVRCLKASGYCNLLLKTRAELDLTRQSETADFLLREKPDYIFMAAAKVGGICANNDSPAEFIYKNLMIEANIIHSAWLAGIDRLLFMGSSCIYPRDCPQPIKEEYLLTGPLEKTNDAYALAKIAGLKMCESYNRQYGASYVAVMPTNLYGPNDNYDLAASHVLPALLRKAHEAKRAKAREMTVWGTGSPRREFLHVDDLAKASVFLMEHKDIRGGLFNVGTGRDIPIRELAVMVAETVGFPGEIVFDSSKPDGTPRKLLDIEKISRLGWRAAIDLPEGLAAVYQDFLEKRVKTIDLPQCR
jgi:GDP-L-fucose synthase